MERRNNYIIVTSCYGENFWRIAPRWAIHTHRITKMPVEIVSLDGVSHDDDKNDIRTIVIKSPSCARGYGDGDRYRLERIIAHLNDGNTTVHIDLDAIIKRDISGIIDLPFDFIISRAFAFPEFVAKSRGFVGCTGFYIAKPSSLTLCEEILSAISNPEHESKLDQFVLNRILHESTKNTPWKQEDVIIDGSRYTSDVTNYNGVIICVLAAEIILRNANVIMSAYGNHSPKLIQMLMSDDHFHGDVQ